MSERAHGFTETNAIRFPINLFVSGRSCLSPGVPVFSTLYSPSQPRLMDLGCRRRDLIRPGLIASLQGLKSRSDLNGQSILVLRFSERNGHWGVFVVATADQIAMVIAWSGTCEKKWCAMTTAAATVATAAATAATARATMVERQRRQRRWRKRRWRKRPWPPSVAF